MMASLGPPNIDLVRCGNQLIDHQAEASIRGQHVVNMLRVLFGCALDGGGSLGGHLVCLDQIGHEVARPARVVTRTHHGKELAHDNLGRIRVGGSGHRVGKALHGGKSGTAATTLAEVIPRPLLFLDVDGPLLPFGTPTPASEMRPLPASPVDRLRPGIGAHLAALPCTLVWATTWQDDANAELAPRLGLPSLPVVTWPESTPARTSEDQWFGLCWKTRTLVDWAAGRPFAWVDDEITESDRDWVAAHHRGPALLHHVDNSRGLVNEDFAVLDTWLRQVA